MKVSKVLSVLLVSVLLISCFTIVSHADEYDAKIEIEYHVADSGNIVVTATLNDIKAKNGVLICEYDIVYDASSLKLVESSVNIPDSWKPYYEEGADSDVENFSMLMNEGLYRWSILSVRVNSGIVDDDQLFIVLEFEKLNNSQTKIEFNNGSVITEYEKVVNGNPQYDFYQLTTNNATIDINLGSPETPDINTDISNPVLLPPPNSEDVSQGGNGNISRDPIKIPQHGGNGPAAGENPTQADDITEEDIEENSENNSSGNTTLIWVLCVIVAVLAVFVVIYIIVAKKSKDSKND